MLKKTLLALLSAGLLTGSASAAIQPGAFTLSPMYGGQVFEGNQSLDDAKLWSIGVGYNYSEHFAVEALYGSSDGDAEAEDATTSDTELQHYRVDALYHFMPSSSFVPYLAAGAGMTSYDGQQAMPMITLSSTTALVSNGSSSTTCSPCALMFAI